MAKHKVTAKTLPLVWIRLTKWVADEIENNEGGRHIAADVDRWLDELASADAFGTEAQCDPRGDQRD